MKLRSARRAFPCLNFSMFRLPPRPPLFPYTTLFRSPVDTVVVNGIIVRDANGGATTGYLVASPLASRSEEHTSELQSRQYLVCRLLLGKKKEKQPPRSAICPTGRREKKPRRSPDPLP